MSSTIAFIGFIDLLMLIPVKGWIAIAVIAYICVGIIWYGFFEKKYENEGKRFDEWYAWGGMIWPLALAIVLIVTAIRLLHHLGREIYSER